MQNGLSNDKIVQNKKNELITGDQVGRVTVWSLKSGKPIYLWEAHPKSAITQMWKVKVD